MLTGISSRPISTASTLEVPRAESQATSGTLPVATMASLTDKRTDVSSMCSSCSLSMPCCGFFQASRNWGPSSRMYLPSSLASLPSPFGWSSMMKVRPLRENCSFADSCAEGAFSSSMSASELMATSGNCKLTALNFDSRTLRALSDQTMAKWTMASLPSTISFTSEGEGAQMPFTVLEHITCPVATGSSLPSSSSATWIGWPKIRSWEMSPKYHLPTSFRNSVMPELNWFEVYFETELKFTPTV
mmetsp:Transcript_93218/g.268386  ORF Transcript_93218/g.268386 Transcript_93218/m.268386 type:complete len:245 (-) Transcript_93218:1594-2328(-)